MAKWNMKKGTLKPWTKYKGKIRKPKKIIIKKKVLS